MPSGYRVYVERISKYKLKSGMCVMHFENKIQRNCCNGVVHCKSIDFVNIFVCCYLVFALLCAENTCRLYIDIGENRTKKHENTINEERVWMHFCEFYQTEFYLLCSYVRWVLFTWRIILSLAN